MTSYRPEIHRAKIKSSAFSTSKMAFETWSSTKKVKADPLQYSLRKIVVETSIWTMCSARGIPKKTTGSYRGTSWCKNYPLRCPVVWKRRDLWRNLQRSWREPAQTKGTVQSWTRRMWSLGSMTLPYLDMICSPAKVSDQTLASHVMLEMPKRADVAAVRRFIGFVRCLSKMFELRLNEVCNLFEDLRWGTLSSTGNTTKTNPSTG